MPTDKRSQRGKLDTSLLTPPPTRSSTCLPRKQHTQTGWSRQVTRSTYRKGKLGRRQQIWTPFQTTKCPRCSTGKTVLLGLNSGRRLDIQGKIGLRLLQI